MSNALERETAKERKEIAVQERKERDEKLTEINKRYQVQIDKLKADAHNERSKIWDKWKERRDAS